jgi:phosphoglucosamine mutase
MIFLDHHTAGDGIITALQLLAANGKDGQTPVGAGEMDGDLSPKLINVDVRSKPDIATIPQCDAVIEGVEKESATRGASSCAIPAPRTCAW